MRIQKLKIAIWVNRTVTVSKIRGSAFLRIFAIFKSHNDNKAKNDYKNIYIYICDRMVRIKKDIFQLGFTFLTSFVILY